MTVHVMRASKIADRPTEPETIRRAQAGDRDAFGTLYHLHAPRVYALALRLTGDRHAASEVTQDAFVRAWQRVGSFRGESAFATWLHRLTVNVALEAGRSDRRRLDRVEPRDPAVLTLHRATDAHPGLKLDLDDAIRLLPDRSRQVFVLHDVEGYDFDEIAVLTGLASSSLRGQLSRARERLRQLLER